MFENIRLYRWQQIFIDVLMLLFELIVVSYLNETKEMSCLLFGRLLHKITKNMTRLWFVLDKTDLNL